VFEALQIDSESVIELRDRARQDHGPPRRALLNDREALGFREFLHLFEVARIGAEFLREILALQMLPASVLPLMKRLDSLLQRVAGAMSQQHRDFEPLGRVGLAYRLARL
jgi:hypothetical protein